MGDEANEYYVRKIKDRLREYREAEKEIENQTERLERLVSKMEGIGAKEITDMPRSPSPPTDRISSFMNQKIEIEECIAEDVAALDAERKAIESILKHLQRADERAVIRFRYLMGLDWYEVADAMYGGRTDYLDKEESYLKRVFRLHGSALLSIAVYLKEEAEPE